MLSKCRLIVRDSPPGSLNGAVSGRGSKSPQIKEKDGHGPLFMIYRRPLARRSGQKVTTRSRMTIAEGYGHRRVMRARSHRSRTRRYKQHHPEISRVTN